MPGTKTTSHQELAARLGLAVGRLGRTMRRSYAAEGLTPSQLSALYLIDREGPLRVGDLAVLEGVSPPTITRIIDAVERAGLITRSIDPNDRRQMQLALTKNGARFLERARRGKNAFLTRRLQTLSAGELDVLERATAVIERLLEEDRPASGEAR